MHDLNSEIRSNFIHTKEVVVIKQFLIQLDVELFYDNYVKENKILHTEVTTRGVQLKKVFLKFSKNSQENTCARASFLINFVKKETLEQALSCEFSDIFKNTFYTEHLWTTASAHSSLVLLSKIYLDIREKIVTLLTLENWTLSLYKKKQLLRESFALSSEKIQALTGLNEDNYQAIHWVTFASQMCFGETVTLNGSKFSMQQHCNLHQ